MMAEVLAIQQTQPHETSPYFSAAESMPPHSTAPSFSLEPSHFTQSQADTTQKQNISYHQISRNDDISSADISSTSSSPHIMATDDFDHRHSSLSTPPSSVSLDNQHDSQIDDDDFLPSYGNISLRRFSKPLEEPASPTFDDTYDASASATESINTADSEAASLGINTVADDTCVRQEPSRQVDYLSHEWKEEDIWCSWKHIVSRRKIYGERSRLENASWRTWTKSKYNLKTISPEALNWLKDCDVTWLYGPLQEAPTPRHTSEPASQLSKSNSFLNKKPILKKRSVSEVMLQKSLSTSSLVRQAAAAVQAQRSSMRRKSDEPKGRTRVKPELGGLDLPTNAVNTSTFPSTDGSSSPASGLQSPDDGRKHIRFDNKVEQCIAVDFKQGSGTESDYFSSWMKEDIAESSEEDLMMMKTKPRKQTPTPSSRRNSINSEKENNGIAMLPATTIKFHHEPEESVAISAMDPMPSPSAWKPGKIFQSPSQETLRPSRPSANFLLDEDDVDADMSWEPAGAFERSSRSLSAEVQQRGSTPGPDAHLSGGLRRTPSGMFMPLEDDEDEENAGFGQTGILGRVVDTVNTARDIAHVIWNVGWRK